jgi:hypothetical protein
MIIGSYENDNDILRGTMVKKKKKIPFIVICVLYYHVFSQKL